MPTRTDKAISHGKGKIKAAEAKLKGLSGVFKTLSEQHGQVSALLKRAENDPDERDDLWPKIRAELTSHERGELAVVYPELRLHAETRAFAEEHEAEASELEATIAQLDLTPIGSVKWGEVLDRLIDLVDHHVDYEEKTIFPVAQKVIGDKRAKELESRFLIAKKREMEAV